MRKRRYFREPRKASNIWKPRDFNLSIASLIAQYKVYPHHNMEVIGNRGRFCFMVVLGFAGNMPYGFEYRGYAKISSKNDFMAFHDRSSASLL
jgi:hypothetical protein